MPEQQWVDFRAVKAAITMQMLRARYNFDHLRQSGQELRGKCPLHQGDGERTFHVNLDKNVFHCFSCHARGNVLDLVAALEQCTVREAAAKLAAWYGIDAATSSASFPAERGKKATAQPAAKAASEKAEPTTCKLPADANPPLAFALRVDTQHVYGQSRGVSAAVLEQFGAGLCLSKGTFAGRFVIPLHDATGQLVGYAGRALGEAAPKYLFPAKEKGFYKSGLVFNLHRLLQAPESDAPIVVVEGFFDCFKVTQAGLPCVALLGTQLSARQEELLAAAGQRFILCLDGDQAGREATDACLSRLARRAFVRVVMLPEDTQPDQFDSAALRQWLTGG